MSCDVCVYDGTPVSANSGALEKLADERDRFLGRAHVRTVTRCLHDTKCTSWRLAMRVFTHGRRCNDVVRALQHQRRDAYVLQIRPIVGEEGRLGEASCDH